MRPTEWHFGTNPGRVKLEGVLAPTGDPNTVIRNFPNYSEIEVMGVRPGAQGLGWIRESILPGNITLPTTVRMMVNIPDAGTIRGAIVSLGPLTYINGGKFGSNFGTWGTGAYFDVVADPTNTASRFLTTLPPAGIWKGAEISFRNGPNAGCQLKVANFGPTGWVTVDGAFPAIPSASDKGMVNFRGRLLPTPDYNGPLTGHHETEAMDAWLWEEYGTDRPWIELSCTWGPTGPGHATYDRGRTVMMSLPTWRSGLFFGRSPYTAPTPTEFRTIIRIESLSIEGPQRETSAGDGDQFLIKDPVTGHSTRVAASEGVMRITSVPVVNADTITSNNALFVPGTWREGGAVSCVIEEAADHVIVCVRGKDAAGVERYGYVKGTWDGTQLQWEDEVPPAGKSNPFLSLSDLPSGPMPDDGWGTGPGPWVQILQLDDGWALLSNGTPANPDHYRTRMLRGAPDRWSFHYSQWAGLVLPGIGGVEQVTSYATSTTLWGNRDSEWYVARNPFATDPSRKLLGYGRIKTIRPDSSAIGNNWRPLGGFKSSDLRTFYPFPNGNQVGPIGGHVYTPRPYVIADDCTAIIVPFGTVANGRLWASNDDVHFQEVSSGFLPWGIHATFCIGDKRFYVGKDAAARQTWAYIRKDSEAYYAGDGWLETVPANPGTFVMDAYGDVRAERLASGAIRFTLGAGAKLYSWHIEALPPPTNPPPPPPPDPDPEPPPYTGPTPTRVSNPLFCLDPGTIDDVQALNLGAEAGYGIIRWGFLWPNIEPQAGQWDTEVMDRAYRICQQTGQRLLVVLGYTPSWAGQKAINATDAPIEQANFTWHPKDPVDFDRYLDFVMTWAKDKTINDKPLVAAWELWNEADMEFYWGDWNRYNDMLRLTYASAKKHSPNTPVILGNSTGNFEAMGMTVSGASKYCFDYQNVHLGGAIEPALRTWYTGTQALPWIAGNPAPTWATENYGQGRSQTVDYRTYDETPDDMARLYYALATWGLGGYTRAAQLGGFVGGPNAFAPGTAILNTDLTPTDLYPEVQDLSAWLQKAVYAGPYGNTHIFIDGEGVAVQALWPDDNFDSWFADRSTVPQAMLNKFSLLVDTPHGVPGGDQLTYPWYPGTLRADYQALTGNDISDLLKPSLNRAAVAIGKSNDASGLLNKARLFGYNAMQTVISHYSDSNKVAACLVRLASYITWLGKISDALYTDRSLAVTATSRVRAMQETLKQKDATFPLTQRLVRSAVSLLDGNDGSLHAADLLVLAAKQLLQKEQGQMLAVVPVVDFTTGEPIRKARLLSPGGHTLTVTVHNHINHDASGYLNIQLPAEWQTVLAVDTSRIRFNAPANGSDSFILSITIATDDPYRPHETVTTKTAAGDIQVEVPTGLNSRPLIKVGGTLDTGERIPEVFYYPNVGRLPNG